LAWGHACNAFQTTDKGLIFIDCTGEGVGNTIVFTPRPIHGNVYGEASSRDTVVYIEMGEVYGIISLDKASFYGFDYSAYETWQQDMTDFETELAIYNQMLGNPEPGSIILVPEDLYRIYAQQEAKLNNLAQRLGGFYEPLGTIGDIKIYW
jgi:hypothetical protein